MFSAADWARFWGYAEQESDKSNNKRHYTYKYDYPQKGIWCITVTAVAAVIMINSPGTHSFPAT